MRIKSLVRPLITAGAALMLTLASCAPANDPPPAPPPEPVGPADVQHRVSYSGETLAQIASWYTGKSSNWSAIRAANPGLRPERISLGQVITVPGALVVEREPMPKRFIQGNLAKVKKTTPADGSSDSRPGDSVSPDLGKTEAPGGEVPKDEVDLDALLNEQIAAEANKNPVAAPPAENAVKAGDTPSESGSAAQVPPPAPPKNGDAEREQLLDELLTQ